MTPDNELQRRFFVYVLGPNQDPRLASVAAGAVLTEILLEMDTDAPFVLTGRSVCCDFANPTGGGLPSDALVSLPGLKTTWTGPNRDYRHSGGSSSTRSYLLESLQMAYYGIGGNPKPIVPGIVYPPGSILALDLNNVSSYTQANLTFYWWGYKLFPKGSFPAYTYPRRMATQSFSYPVFQSQMIQETRYNQIFTVKQDADFVLRGGQSFLFDDGPADNPAHPFQNVSILLKDFNKQPYMSDFVPLPILFGGGDYLPACPFGAKTAGPWYYTPLFGTGPSAPGLMYPEIYLPKNQQLLYDIQRRDTLSVLPRDVSFNLIGAKVFQR